MEADGGPFTLIYNGSTLKLHFKKAGVGCVCGYRPRRANTAVIDTKEKWDAMTKIGRETGELKRNPCDTCFASYTLPEGWEFEGKERGASYEFIAGLDEMGVKVCEPEGEVNVESDSSDSSEDSSNESSDDSIGTQRSIDSQAVRSKSTSPERRTK